jgi:two-component system, NarL family, sensor histidine kinase DesK
MRDRLEGVTAMWRRWSGQSGPERYDFWTRASLYAPLAVVPLLALALEGAQHQVRVSGLVAFVLLSVTQAAACVAVLRAGLSHYLARGPGPKRWLVAAAIAVTAAGLLAGAAAFPAFTRIVAGQIPVSAWVAMLFCGALTAALTPLLSLPALFAVVLAGAVAVSAWSASTGGAGSSGPAFVGGFQYLLYSGVAALIYRISAWTLRIMWELDRSRTAHARLSVAEERLRFARDLHDVLGRNLSLVAVKSELAAQLARRGDEQAAGHMLEVRRVAHDSLREMRAVISGYRTADLGTELAGAQAVLRSAGVSCRIIGDATGLPHDVQAALGWVVREGTTNIIRHSDATACTIELHVLDSSGTARTVTLRIDNDRAHTAEAGARGNGLLGLGERLAGLGGSITAQHPRSGHFRLEATLPASGAAQVPLDPGPRGTGATAEQPAP